MPKSRKRKLPHHSSSPAPSRRSRSNKAQKVTVVVIIAAVFVALVVFALSRGWSGSRNGVPGVEITTPSGLKYTDEVIGTGENPRPGSTVTVHYTGTFPDGRKFDSSFDRGQPMVFRLGIDPMVKGWEEGMMTMKVGGKRKLIVPPELGYGAKGRSGIPPNSTLVFEIELLGVK